MKLSMTVAELEERMTHSEYVLWNAYFSRIAQRKQLAAGNG
jgi:predicted kinase